MKSIRELRMGPPKTWKTGSVVTSYPKPLLVFEGDEGGLDVIPKIDQWIPLATDTTNEMDTWCLKKREELPAICAVQFNTKLQASLNDLFQPTADTKSFANFNKTVNSLFLKGCPWKTVVIDPVTIIQDMVLASFAASNAKKLEDARKWAGAVGEKTKRIMATLYTLPCHVVIIMHTAKVKITNPTTNEVISEIQEPVIYGKIRDFIGSLPSQFFFHDSMVVGGQRTANIYTTADGRVKGIGARWPANLAPKVGPTFNDIYGEAVKKGETWA